MTLSLRFGPPLAQRRYTLTVPWVGSYKAKSTIRPDIQIRRYQGGTLTVRRRIARRIWKDGRSHLYGVLCTVLQAYAA